MKHLLNQLPAKPELAMVSVLIGIVAVLIIPLGRLMLDVLTVVSMASCLLVLLVAARIRSPVELLTFPALLLLTTMLRLALNVASTKMILLEGKAGHVVETFGKVFMAENLLVGLCVFAIVTVVQFLVVAKGADRVAEVAARFSLDAMPGKQMSIDAEMRAGSLTGEQASARREQLDIESRFFGGMDGAMKFVKGDAIAGLVITIVNILGGLASGMLYHGMSASVAMKRYSMLSIGDAMVAQIPSFMLAVAAGLVTTRVTSSRESRLSLAQQITAEVRRHPTSLGYVGASAVLLSLLPGFPVAVFLVLGAVLLSASYFIGRQNDVQSRSAAGFDRLMPSFSLRREDPPPPFIDLRGDSFDAPLLISIPPVLAERINPEDLDKAMADVRRRLASNWGAPFPGVRCRLLSVAGGPASAHDFQLRWTLNGSYDIPVPWNDSSPLHLGEPHPHDDGPLGVPGYPDARWGEQGESGATLEHLLARVTEHLCIREQTRLLTHEQFSDLMTALRASHPQLTEALVAAIPLPVLTDVVRSLLREGIDLRLLPQVCDALLSFTPLPQDANLISEMVVNCLSRRRSADAAEAGVVKVHLVDPAIELVLSAYASAVPGSDPGENPLPRLDLDIFREVRALFSDLARQHPRGRINLACRGGSRLLVSETAAMASSRFRVFSLRGINPRFDVKVVAHVAPSAALRQRMAELESLGAITAHGTLLNSNDVDTGASFLDDPDEFASFEEHDGDPAPRGWPQRTPVQ